MTSMEPSTFHVESADGTSIGGLRVGSGPALVLVHGTGGSSQRWIPLLPRLSEHHTVYAVDRRGRGESGDPAGPYLLSAEAEDLCAVIDATDPARPVALFGHSYGGLCSMEAAMRTDRIDKLMLYEPALVVEGSTLPPGLLDAFDEVLATEGNEALVIRFFTEVVGMGPDALETLKGASSWPDRVAAAPTLTRELRTSETYPWDPARVATISVPTRVMMGSLSPGFLTHAARTVRMAIPHATLSVLDGQQHVAMDTAPELFLATVFDFLGA